MDEASAPGGGLGLAPDATPKAAAPAVSAAYLPQEQLHGRLRSVGSDTMDRLMLGWQQGFVKYHAELAFFTRARALPPPFRRCVTTRRTLVP